MPTTTLPYRLLAPGPVPVPPTVLKAMSGKVLHHRTPEFENILIKTWAGLQKVFNTTQPVQILTGTGSAAMEAAIVNTLSPGDEALVVVSGKFGERWADMCVRAGVITHRLDVAWGEPVALDAFKAKLKAHPNVKVVMTQVCETSTATVHPIKEMSALVKSMTKALFSVDAITAVGCMPLPMDEWGLDVVVAGSQKAFMIPTGLSFIAMSKNAWAAQAESKCFKFYLDLAAEKKANDRKETLFSTPTPLIVGLNMVLEQMLKVSMRNVEHRCNVLAEATRTAGEMLGFKTYSKAPSSSVTALITPKNIDSAKFRDWLEKERNITVMGGQDQAKGKIIRIGHMGDIRDEDMVALVQAMKEGVEVFTNSAPFDHAQLMPKLNAKLKTAEPLFPEAT